MPITSRLVMIGASAGGPHALKRLLGGLPADFPAPVLVVVHIGNHYSTLPRLLARETALPVRHAVDGEPVEPGAVLLAPPDRHMLLDDGMVRLTLGAKENFSRPAIDPLFRTGAMHYRENAIGVILSGLLDDGTIGLQAIKSYGGSALVQDPEEADEPSMPRSALTHVKVDACLAVDALAERLVAIAATQAIPVNERPEWKSIEAEASFDLRQKSDIRELEEVGKLSTFTCPECSGTLWEVPGEHLPHFRCHTGHSFTVQGLSMEQDVQVEEAMWAAIRALHEKQLLLERLAESSAAKARPQAVAEHKASAKKAADHAEILRKMATGRAPP